MHPAKLLDLDNDQKWLTINFFPKPICLLCSFFFECADNQFAQCHSFSFDRKVTYAWSSDFALCMSLSQTKLELDFIPIGPIYKPKFNQISIFSNSIRFFKITRTFKIFEHRSIELAERFERRRTCRFVVGLSVRVQTFFSLSSCSRADVRYLGQTCSVVVQSSTTAHQFRRRLLLLFLFFFVLLISFHFILSDGSSLCIDSILVVQATW